RSCAGAGAAWPWRDVLPPPPKPCAPPPRDRPRRLRRLPCGRGVDTAGKQRGGLVKTLAQPNLQACGLVAYTCRLGLSDPAPAAAPDVCARGKDQYEGDESSRRQHGFHPVMIEPKRLPKEIDDSNPEPPELHSPPPHLRSPRRIFYSGSGMNSVSSPGT